MRVLLHDYAGHIFQIELSRELARRGHEVIHAFSSSLQTPQGDLERRQDDPAGLRFQSLNLGVKIRKNSYVLRRQQEIAYARLLRRLVLEERPDVVISANTPTDVQWRLAALCRSLNIRLISWIQDVYSVAVRHLLRRKLPVIGDLIGRYYMRLDRAAARQSDAIILITEDFRPQMEAWGVPPERICVIPNWAPLKDLPPTPKDNRWSRAMGLHDKVCLTYSGTLALKHNPALLLELAKRFRNDLQVRIVVVTEGASADWLAKEAKEAGLTNLVLMPFQPFQDMPFMLASADVLIAILEPDAGVFSVPSKVLTYLCASRPLLLSVPPANLAARVTRESGAGIVVAPSDFEGFIRAAGELVADPAKRNRHGENARAYAERHFDIKLIGDRFEGIIGLPGGRARLVPNG